jgi:hypothetical protein
MAKDFTKYTVNGSSEQFGKARLVQKVIELYVQDFKGSYEDLKSLWPDNLQGGSGVVKLLSEIDSSNEKSYYKDSPVRLLNGDSIAVCNQWGKGNISDFIIQANRMGYVINTESQGKENETPSSELELPEAIKNNLTHESNVDENIFFIYNYVNEFIKNDDDLEALYLKIINFKPNAQLAGQYAWSLFLIGRTETAKSILANKDKYSGDEFAWKIFNESDRDIKRNLKYNQFQQYLSKEGEELELVINIYGRLHQLFQCKKEEDEVIDEIENHYENACSAFFKIDSDNLISIELDGEKIFEGEISTLGINENDLQQVSEVDKVSKINIANNLAIIPQSKCFNEIDVDQINVSTINNLLVVSEGSLDYGRQLKFAPNFENRYTMVEYGKYHIQTSPIKLKSFKISDLFFQKDTCIEDLLGPTAEGISYCFSKIFHLEFKELEFEIQENNVKSTDFAEGWISDC